MIYLDTSVALAHLLAEDRQPSTQLWNQLLVSSRLLEYEMWNRVYARGLRKTHSEAVRQIIGRVSLLDLTPPVLARALEPFPIAVRTLDALHLASIEFLRGLGQEVVVASYDMRLVEAAQKMGIPVEERLLV